MTIPQPVRGASLMLGSHFSVFSIHQNNLTVEGNVQVLILKKVWHFRGNT